MSIPQALENRKDLEAALADRARDGDQDALIQLYRKYREPLHRYAWRMLGDPTAAVDVVQEAFARAIPAIPRTTPGLNFKAWIFRIVINLCLRELNRRGRTFPSDDPEPLADAMLPRAEPSSHYETREQLQAALDQLPDRYRQILLLREVEDLTYEELAEALELSEANVKVLLHRARARFAALFLAEQLLSDVEHARNCGCRELVQILEAKEPRAARRKVERHLEGCAHCQRAVSPPRAELWALLPVPPAAALPDQLLARTPAQTAPIAGTSAGGLSMMGWLAASVALLGVLGAGALLIRAKVPSLQPTPPLASPVASPSPAGSPLKRASLDEPPGLSSVQARGGPPLASPSVSAGSRTQRGGDVTAHALRPRSAAANKAPATAGKRRPSAIESHRKDNRPPARVQQLADPESP